MADEKPSANGGQRADTFYDLVQHAHLMRFPGGDSLQDLISRSADAVRRTIELYPDKTVVLVSHDSVNRALLLQLADFPIRAYWRLAQSPCCINEIEVIDGQIRILAINETSHLDRLDHAG